jgi:hypothetical protein
MTCMDVVQVRFLPFQNSIICKLPCKIKNATLCISVELVVQFNAYESCQNFLRSRYQVLVSPYFFCFLIGFNLFLQQLLVTHQHQCHVLVFKMLLCHSRYLFRRDPIDVFHAVRKVAVA